ncbi:MAG: alcohol dehydrogenase catalytic domain-containing protein [bacterium]|nr:alcohol dehydrogenase catalytic domain-containing protein [bacterium]
MQVIKLTGIRAMQMLSVPEPALARDRDVLVRMRAVGVCGSDIHYYTSGRIGRQMVQYPFAVGHECAGEIVRVGAAVTRLKPGDRVAVDPAMPCGVCDQCRAGRPHTCRALRFLGCPGQAEGCLAEYLVLPEQCCFSIKDTMTFDQAAASEPLAIGVYAVSMSMPVRGARIGILGFGPIGMSVLLAAMAHGADKIYGSDKLDERLAIARAAGATWAGNPQRRDIVADVQRQEPALLDTVFECCGDQAALDQALLLLKPGGTLMLVGIPEVDRVSFSIDELRHREIRIQNVRRQNDCVQRALDLIDQRQINIDAMVTHHYPFARTQEAFDTVAAYRDGVMKAIITF